MKNKTPMMHLTRPCLVLAFALAISLPVQLQSAEHREGKEAKMESRMMEACGEMMHQMQEMQAKVKAQDAELIAAVALMNRAPEDEKLDLLAGVVTQLVEQRTAMHTQKKEMQEKMMQHMMQHMQMGKESMEQCPIMKSMGEKSDGDHKDHQKKQK